MKLFPTSLFSFVVISDLLLAAPLDCQWLGALHDPAPAPVQVSCETSTGDLLRGRMKKDEHVASITLALQDSGLNNLGYITLDNPRRGLYDYYRIFHVEEDSQILLALDEAGIESEQVHVAIAFGTFRAKGGTEIFWDWDARESLGKL